MTKKTKLILSIIGVAAIIVPAFLLIITSGRSNIAPSVSSSKRTIDSKDITNKVKSLPSPSPRIAISSPSSTASASPKPNSEGSSSAR